MRRQYLFRHEQHKRQRLGNHYHAADASRLPHSESAASVRGSRLWREQRVQEGPRICLGLGCRARKYPRLCEHKKEYRNESGNGIHKQGVVFTNAAKSEQKSLCCT